MFITDSTQVSLDGTVIDHNAAAGRGGGMLVQQRSAVAVGKGVIVGNTAGTGGGLCVASDSRVAVTASWINLNRAQTAGAGIAVRGDAAASKTSLVLAGTSVTANVAASSGGVCLLTHVATGVV